MLLRPGDKARNVLRIIYMEDIPSYGALLEFLDGLKLPCACSPVHDRDTYTHEDINKWIRNHTDPKIGKIPDDVLAAGLPEVGNAKKAHVHVVITLKGPRDGCYFSDLFAPFVKLNPLQWEKCESVESSLRYFAHMDTPEKAQYSPLDVKGFGGIDLGALLKTSKISNLQTLMGIMDYIIEYKVRHYNKLVRWALSTGDIDIIACVTGRASFFASFFRSESDERKEKAEKERKEKESSQGTNSPEIAY